MIVNNTNAIRKEYQTSMFQVLLLIGVIIGVICLSKHQEKEVYNNKLKEINDFKIECAKTGNRNLLKEFGETKFALIYGEDQLQLVKNNQDTKSVELVKDWEKKLNGCYYQYK